MELVVMCGEKPTRSLLQTVFDKIKKVEISISLHLQDGSITATKLYQSETVTINIYFTSSKFQPNDDQTGKMSDFWSRVQFWKIILTLIFLTRNFRFFNIIFFNRNFCICF